MKKQNTQKKIQLKKISIVSRLEKPTQEQVKGGSDAVSCNQQSSFCSKVPLC
ncbi:hypothetical protein [Taibaiella koreensis]|uniref:hypothetical protein n=1 Tax=Taibaiella koreensis TaxID=1268548 RepID=UPI0013C31E2E|nr:hypothetical protein [Taibaiella koreensis]